MRFLRKCMICNFKIIYDTSKVIFFGQGVSNIKIKMAFVGYTRVCLGSKKI